TELFDRRRVSARDNMVCTETLGFIKLVLARRERGHVATVRGGKLYGHMPHPADADNADSVSRPGVHGQRCEDGDSPAQERPGFGGVQLFRQRQGPSPMRADVSRDPAAMTDDRRLHLRAKVMVSRKALVTVHIAARVPADADALSDMDSLGIRTDSRDPTDNFVAENRGVL